MAKNTPNTLIGFARHQASSGANASPISTRINDKETLSRKASQIMNETDTFFEAALRNEQPANDSKLISSLDLYFKNIELQTSFIKSTNKTKYK